MTSSIVTRLARVRSDADIQTKAGEFTQLARALAMAGPQGGVVHALQLAREQNASARVVECLRSAVAEGSTTSMAELVSYQSLAAGFLETLARSSAFEAIRASGGWRILPIHTRVGAVSAALVASQTGESQSKPISSLQLSDSGVLSPVKAAAIVVLTNELARFSGAIGQQIMSNELRTALGVRVDDVAFTLLLASPAANAASAGTTAADAWEDIAFLLAAVEVTAQSKLFFLAHPAVLKSLATRNNSGLAAFPDLGATGGEILGVPVLPSDGLDAGVLALTDANAVAVGDDGVVLSQANHASIQLDNAPDSPPTNPVSLWMQNMVGLRAERRIALQPLSDTAAAYVSNVGISA